MKFIKKYFREISIVVLILVIVGFAIYTFDLRSTDRVQEEAITVLYEVEEKSGEVTLDDDSVDNKETSIQFIDKKETEVESKEEPKKDKTESKKTSKKEVSKTEPKTKKEVKESKPIVDTIPLEKKSEDTIKPETPKVEQEKPKSWVEKSTDNGVDLSTLVGMTQEALETFNTPYGQYRYKDLAHQVIDESKTNKCTVTIDYQNYMKLTGFQSPGDPDGDGFIVKDYQSGYYQGGNCWDAVAVVLHKEKIDYDCDVEPYIHSENPVFTSKYGGCYISMIGNIYHKPGLPSIFDDYIGPVGGWVVTVNGVSIGFSLNYTELRPGDNIYLRYYTDVEEVENYEFSEDMLDKEGNF